MTVIFPFADPADVAVFLDGVLNEARAELLLGMVADLIVAEAGVRDSYDDALRVVAITATARAYSNALGAGSQSAGGVSLTVPGGVYLTADEKRKCRGGSTVTSVRLRHRFGFDSSDDEILSS